MSYFPANTDSFTMKEYKLPHRAGYLKLQFWLCDKFNVGSVNDFTGGASVLNVTCPVISLPSIKINGGTDIGFFMQNDVEIVFYNKKISTYDNTLWDIFHNEDPEHYVWHLRIFHRFVGGAYGDAFYHGLLDMSEDAGQLITLDTRENTAFSCTFGSPTTLLEIQRVQDMVDNYLLHATYDYKATNLYTTAYRAVAGPPIYNIQNIYYKDGEKGTWGKYDMSTHLNFFKLRDIAQACVNSVFKPERLINNGNSIDGWTFRFKHPSIADIDFNFDDAYIPVSVLDNSLNHMHGFGMFDPNTKFSIFNLSNPLEVLKWLLIPFGLTMTYGIDSGTGNMYPIIRPWANNTGVGLASSLVGIEIETPDVNAKGIRVLTLFRGTEYNGASDDKHIDNPFLLGGEKIPYNNRITESPSACDDVVALMQTIFLRKPGTDDMYACNRVIPVFGGNPMQFSYTLAGAMATYYFSPDDDASYFRRFANGYIVGLPNLVFDSTIEVGNSIDLTGNPAEIFYVTEKEYLPDVAKTRIKTVRMK